MKYTGLDRHINPNGVLKNHFDIQDQATLDQVEQDITLYKMSILNDKPIQGRFDLQHLQAIHKHLFEDIYPFAGEIRDGYLQKDGQDFTMGYRIVPQAQKLFAQLKQEHYLQQTPADNMAARLAYYLGEINVLHPFREGNGRTQRIFIMQLAKQAGYELKFDNVTQDEMINASIAAHRCEYHLLEQIIQAGLSPITQSAVKDRK